MDRRYLFIEPTSLGIVGFVLAYAKLGTRLRVDR